MPVAAPAVAPEPLVPLLQPANIYIFKHLLQYRTIDALSVSGIGRLLAACAQSIVLSSTAAA